MLCVDMDYAHGKWSTWTICQSRGIGETLVVSTTSALLATSTSLSVSLAHLLVQSDCETVVDFSQKLLTCYMQTKYLHDP